jgi:para-aminobenzoate synthetase component 1
MIPLPEPNREVTLADWSAAGTGWDYLPYIACFPARQLPSSWEGGAFGRFTAVLESGPTGRHTLLLPDARRAWTFHPDGQATLHLDGEIQQLGLATPLAWLDQWASTHRSPRLAGWPDFQGGLVAAIGYELASSFEPVTAQPADPPLPLAVFLEASATLVHDAATGDLFAVVLCSTRDPAVNAHEAARILARRLARTWDYACSTPAPILSPAATPVSILRASLDEAAFTDAARRTQEYIAAGDTYQVNLSTRLELPSPPSGLLAYEAVRSTNPSPYMGYLRLPEVELICGSPELLVECSSSRISSRPIAGTRPRTGQAEEDLAFARELAGDSKERAEHLMLVDLLRNDIGRVSIPGTVCVPEFMAVERYSHVMHLVSQIEGRLPEPPPPLSEIIRATFPGGTVTGAPKVRTLQIIAELEPVARGFYTGSVGWIAASGDLCLNIVIRTLTLTQGRCFAQAGAGVVADSIPGREYAESLRKALALRVALGRLTNR